MQRSLSRWWRVARTGAAFAVFGLGGAILPAVVFPVVRWQSRDANTAELRAQYLVHLTFRAFVRVMAALGLIEVEVRGAERLIEPGGLVVVANHPTLIDVVILGSLVPQLDCVVKKEAWSNPFMRGVVKATGYVANDLGEDVLDASAARLSRGRALLLFPEGTRSPMGGLGTFRRGAAHVALRSERPILPVVIRCDPPGLMRGQRWFDVPDRSMQFRIEVGEPMEPGPLRESSEPRGAAARRLTGALRDFYEKRLQTLMP
jgi:1-acyl-sn-glycerol-3-phosphate acyltransferase